METLASRIARDGALHATDAVGWVVRLTRSLERMHARGNVHGRVSPHCVRVGGDRCAAAGQILSRARAPERAAYHSPERAVGAEMSVVDDTWAAAVTLYEALCGRPPFQGATDAETRAKITAGKPAPLAAFGIVDPGLQAILDRALNLDWFDRTIDVAALRRDLEAWRPGAGFADLQPLDEAPEGAETTPLPARSAPLSSRPDLALRASPEDDAAEDADADDVPTVSRRGVIEDDEDGPSIESRPWGSRGDDDVPTVARSRDGDGPEPSSRARGLRAEGPASTVAGLRWGSKSPQAKARGAGSASGVDSSPGGPLTPKGSPISDGHGGARGGAASEDEDAYDEYDADSHPTMRAAFPQRDSQPTVPFAEIPEDARRMLAALGIKDDPGDKPARGLSNAAAASEQTPEPTFGRVLEVAPAVARPDAPAASTPPIAATLRPAAIAPGARSPGEMRAEAAPPSTPSTPKRSIYPRAALLAVVLAVLVAGGGLFAQRRGLLGALPGRLMPTRTPAPAPDTNTPPPPPTLAASDATDPAAQGAAPSAAPAATEPAAPASAAASAEPAGVASASPSASPSAASSAAAGSPPGDVNACVRPLFADDTFAPGSTLDFGYLCQETDPRRGGTLMKSRVVAGSAGHVTDGMREWALLGWYQMAAFAVVRARCCPGAPKLTLPSANSTCEPLEGHLDALAAAAGAARDVNDIGLRDTLTELTKAIRCHVKTGGTGPFEWKDSPQGGADTALLKTLARITASR